MEVPLQSLLVALAALWIEVSGDLHMNCFHSLGGGGVGVNCKQTPTHHPVRKYDNILYIVFWINPPPPPEAEAIPIPFHLGR